MTRPTIAVVNGANLNLLGTREPELYGAAALSDIQARCEKVAAGSYLSDLAAGVIVGCGIGGYEFALRRLAAMIN